MYTLNLKSDYVWPISISDGQKLIGKGPTISLKKQGSVILDVPGMGAFNFLDIAATRIPGYPNPQHWGVLIRTHTLSLIHI